MRGIIAVDIGGTFYKGSIIPELTDSAAILDEVRKGFMKMPIKVEDKSEVQTFFDFINLLYLGAGKKDYSISGIGMAFPGPFNFDAGISRMDHKLKDFKGIDLRHELPIHISGLNNDVPLYFFADCHTFGAYEYKYNTTTVNSKFLGITLGTGLGTTFIDNGVILVKPKNGIPCMGSVWDLPYLDGIVEDYVSSRFLLTDYLTRSANNSNITVTEIIDEAIEGKKDAVETLKLMGFHLGRSLKEIIREFCPKMVVVGGGLSVAYDFFISDVRRGAEVLEDTGLFSRSSLNYYSSLMGIKILMDKEIVYE